MSCFYGSVVLFFQGNIFLTVVKNKPSKSILSQFPSMQKVLVQTLEETVGRKVSEIIISQTEFQLLTYLGRHFRKLISVTEDM